MAKKTFNSNILLSVNSYWDGKGEYDEKYHELYDKLVPVSGEAETEQGELLRSISRLYWDYCNNGNGNACEVREIEGAWNECRCCCGSGEIEDEETGEFETCPDCGGDGGWYDESDYEREVNEFFGDFINKIELYFEKYYDNTQVISKLCDEVRDIILTDSDTPNYFGSENMKVYDHLTDYIVYELLTNPMYEK